MAVLPCVVISGRVVLFILLFFSGLYDFRVDLHNPGSVELILVPFDEETSGVAWTWTVYCCGSLIVSDNEMFSSEIKRCGNIALLGNRTSSSIYH